MSSLRFRLMSVLAAGLLGLSLSGSALAVERVLVETDAKAILAQQQEIRAEVASGEGRFEKMAQDDKDRLAVHQAVVQRLLADVTHTTELSAAQQLDVLNALEAISALLNKAEDERLVCERVKKTGSHMSTTVCMTVAERRVRREQEQDAISRRDQRCVDGWASGACR